MLTIAATPCQTSPPTFANIDPSTLLPCVGTASGSVCSPTCLTGYTVTAGSGYTCVLGVWVPFGGPACRGRSLASVCAWFCLSVEVCRIVCYYGPLGPFGVLKKQPTRVLPLRRLSAMALSVSAWARRVDRSVRPSVALGITPVRAIAGKYMHRLRFNWPAHSVSGWAQAPALVCAESGVFEVTMAGNPCNTTPAAVANGNSAVCLNTLSGAFCATGLCNAGYAISGSYTCLLGVWGTPPTCNRKSVPPPFCPLSPSIVLMALWHVHLIWYPHGSLATTVTCLTSSAAAPCNSVPAAVSNGVVSACSGTVSGGSCTPVCNSGYSALGSYACNFGVWSGSASCSLSLYAFTGYTFTPAGAVGASGPSLAQIRSAAATAGQTWAATYLGMSTAGVQEWTVPTTGSYTIDCVGASGSTPNFGTTMTRYGLGARVQVRHE